MATLRIIFMGLFLFNGVFSQETGAPEVDLFTFEIPTALSGCYGEELSSKQLYKIGWLMQFAAVDPLGRRCFKPLSESEAWSLFTKDDLEGAFANASVQACPSWTQSKECLRRHLSNKCDSRETQNVQESMPLNNLLVISELICEPVDGYNMLQMFKDAAVDGGLGDCLSDLERLEEFFACMRTRVNEEESTTPPFKEIIPLFFECGDQTLKVCANGNMDQELALVSLWNKFRKAVQVTYGSLWNDLTAPFSILDLLK